MLHSVAAFCCTRRWIGPCVERRTAPLAMGREESEVPAWRSINERCFYGAAWHPAVRW
jgi:hypothetical protein